ncbi:hypothetical protein [Pseudoalteromonas sp. S558]|uniref:hypothetical protein n=1 Tax=Pseudoalteromonas sp. S558 TaxID=2066515 RepID=UPI00110A4753|nr:hypothetical protein [Pseudoalteromonas sp. S558]TMO02897.1 hypothetical protein CWB66_12230 [Pseudoalteromonas sp. S558]
MIDFTTAIDWTIRTLEVFVVIFLLVTFSKHRQALFFGGKNSLKSINDHTLHSCFIAALTVMVFHFISSNLAQHIITIEMSKLALRQFFYFSMFCCSMAFVITLFFLHAIRGCTFSITARFCLYLALAQALLQMTQFVMRGLFDNSILSPAYSAGVVLLNIASLIVVSIYPIKKINSLIIKERI